MLPSHAQEHLQMRGNRASAAFTDDERLRLAEQRFEEEKLLEAHRLLQTVSDPSLLEVRHNAILLAGAHCKAVISDLIEAPGGSASGWTKQNSELGGHHRDTSIYYKVDTDTARLDCRLETPIGTDLLIPLISVLNESDLYHTWVPRWYAPKIGVRSSRQIHKIGRVNQILQVICDVPWPLSAREVIMKTQVVDEIDENGYFAVILRGVNTDDSDGIITPSLDPDVERIDFEGALLFRPCPTGRALPTVSPNNNDSLILVSFKMFCDPHLSAVPSSALNFITRTVIGQVWEMLLRVAENVRDGRQPEHKLAIEQKPDLYNFVDERVKVMLKQLQYTNIDNEQMQFIGYLQS